MSNENFKNIPGNGDVCFLQSDLRRSVDSVDGGLDALQELRRPQKKQVFLTSEDRTEKDKYKTASVLLTSDVKIPHHFFWVAEVPRPSEVPSADPESSQIALQKAKNIAISVKLEKNGDLAPNGRRLSKVPFTMASRALMSHEGKDSNQEVVTREGKVTRDVEQASRIC
ncbi:hypothetical protein AVEN_194005-1 [Araneus ventricosus]|uniref:Uncharacterized protein n=1 Tax=Araneus ventricosus TaxID=182803 RepID=A0A4Y2LAU0_ARAVE|nr:hypothetical protein AVEN_194005-1 [Araneus ventricosus]